MKVAETPKLNGSKVTLAEQDNAKLKAAFSAERDGFKDEIETIARMKKADKLAIYAEVLFIRSLNNRYQYAQSKLAKVKESAVVILVASGMTEIEARKRLGLIDETAE